MEIQLSYQRPLVSFGFSSAISATGVSGHGRPSRATLRKFAPSLPTRPRCTRIHYSRPRRNRATTTMVLDSRLLALTAIVTVAYQLSFFIVTYLCRFDTLTDFAGSTNFILLAALTLALGAPVSARSAVISTLVFVWGVRLCAFLLSRILAWGEDRRFDDKRENVVQLAIFWSIQAVWVWTVSLPVTLVNATPYNPPISPSDIIGWCIWAIGFVLEAVADAQKTAYKKTPESRGRWTDVGTWKWSRHPNYAGEILCWWGVYISAVRALRGAEHAAVSGPIFITLIILFLSGIPLLESGADKKHASKEEYRAYKKRTSVLFPVPPTLYEKFPDSVKKYVFLDLPLYNKGLNTADVKVSEDIEPKSEEATNV